MPNNPHIAGITSYQEIDAILLNISDGIKNILGQNLVGLYLFGSLTYGDFNPDSSDIDLVAITKKQLSHDEFELIRQLHKNTGEQYPIWRNRLECSYTPIEMLKNILPPKDPRPYFGDGIFYDEAPYGNEWIINNYLLYQYSIPLVGKDFKKLTNPVDILDVQKACVRDLFQEWEPKITDFEWLDNSHYQSYLVLNLCRILYTVIEKMAGTKKVSAEWAKNKFGLPWSKLISNAQAWKYGKEMSSRDETIDFIKFAIDQIKQTSIYQQMDIK
ncbi:MAG TPA: aminoglycoside adenylyltransferase domain-containing protein [Gammaproteobacteria bacterium]|nr:aminoglycoside adenylyltransferase domain-containing protein [Gammaproteobacteria bacterium]